MAMHEVNIDFIMLRVHILQCYKIMQVPLLFVMHDKVR